MIIGNQHELSEVIYRIFKIIVYLKFKINDSSILIRACTVHHIYDILCMRVEKAYGAHRKLNTRQ